MWNAGLDEAKARIKIAGRNINNLKYANDTTLMAESKYELKSLLMKVREESEKVSWKLNIQKTKIMASGPITSWQIDGETVETKRDFIFLGSKITSDGDCTHENKRHLLLGRKAMTNLDSILKSRDITLVTKVCLVKAMVFPVVVYVCENQTIKKSWVPKNWCFWTVVLEKTLESSLDCKEIQPVHPKGDQSWLFIGRTDAEAETPILGQLMQRTDSLEKTLMLGKVEGGRRRGQQGMRWLDGSLTGWTWVWISSGSWWWTEKPGVLQPLVVSELDTTDQLNWLTEVHVLCVSLQKEFTERLSGR